MIGMEEQQTLRRRTEAATAAATAARVLGRLRRLSGELRWRGWLVLEPYQRDVSLAIICGECGEWMTEGIDEKDLVCGHGHRGRREFVDAKGEQVLRLSGTACLSAR
jgi:hypothetical protein